MKQSLAATTRSSKTLSFTAVAILSCAILASACIKRSRNSASHVPTANEQSASSIAIKPAAQIVRLNINTASADDLEKLPGIGTALAARIIDHREKFGPFRKPEHLIIIRGISDKRFRGLRDLITVE